MRCLPVAPALVACSLPLWTADARADGGAVASQSQVFRPDPLAGRPVFDLRVGVDSTDALEHPYLCAEGSPTRRLSLEACGDGSTAWHPGAAPSMMHLRARVLAAEASRGRVEGALLPGVGISEIQVAEDELGLMFGAARSEDQVEGAGPEASVSAKARLWVHEKAYVTVDANVGAAWIPASTVVLDQDRPFVGFGILTAGLGF